MKSKVLLGAVCAAIAAMVAPVAAQAADSIDITYFTIAETDRDANALGFGTVNNEVQNTLGPDGLPVLNTAAYGCSTNCFTLAAPTDVTAGGEITYWSPALNNGGAGGTSDVTQTLTTTTSLPFSVPSNFFPPNGTGSSDYNGFQAAELSGTISVPETEQISFNIGADDMAFAYLDGQIVCDLGGVHGSTAGTCATPFDISAGSHSLSVFFVDINNSQAGLTFGINTQDVTVGPVVPSVPEPSTLALMGVGLLGIGVIAQRRGKSRSA